MIIFAMRAELVNMHSQEHIFTYRYRLSLFEILRHANTAIAGFDARPDWSQNYFECYFGIFHSATDRETALHNISATVKREIYEMPAAADDRRFDTLAD